MGIYSLTEEQKIEIGLIKEEEDFEVVVSLEINNSLLEMVRLKVPNKKKSIIIYAKNKSDGYGNRCKHGIGIKIEKDNNLGEYEILYDKKDKSFLSLTPIESMDKKIKLNGKQMKLVTKFVKDNFEELLNLWEDDDELKAINDFSKAMKDKEINIYGTGRNIK